MNTSPSVDERCHSSFAAFREKLPSALGVIVWGFFTGGTASAQISLPPAGIISTIAGNMNGGGDVLSDGGPAKNALLSQPYGVALDSSGNVYIADTVNNRIREVSASTGIITTVAGNGEMNYLGDSGPAVSAALNGPTGIAVDAIGNLYIADNGNSVVRMVTASTGIITTIAGTGNWGYSGDGGPATSAEMINPNAVAMDASGNLYIADTFNNVIRLVSAGTGIITTVAGSCSPDDGMGCMFSPAYGGDGGPATSARLALPNGIALDSNNNLYIADTYNNVVRMVSASTGIITTIAGNGSNAGNPFAGGYSGDGGPATSASMAGPFGVALDGADSLYIADCYNNVVRMVSPDGVIRTWAGNGIATFAGDGGPATSGSMFYPTSVVLDAIGNLYIADTWNGVIRAVGSPSSQVHRIEDQGAVSLTINGQVVASTTYGEDSTPYTIAVGLTQALVSGAPVTLSPGDGTLYITAKATGPSTNYSYSVQNTQYDNADFSAPSFPVATLSGTLSGGAATGGPSQRPVYLFLGNYDSAGNVTQYTDSVMGSWNFSYDALNRLSSAQNLSTTAASQQYAKEYGCWSYDDFGNRLSQGMSVSPCSGTPTLTSWATYNANNQFVTTESLPGGGVGYDAAGEVTNDGSNAFLYDAEGRLCAVRNGMIGYLYDADGIRIAKGNINQWSCDPSVNGFAVTTDYVLGLGGEQVTEMQHGAWQHTNVFAGGQLLATYDAPGLHFYLNDPLGTRRAQTNYAGNLEKTCSSLPFGDDLRCSGSTTNPTEHHFTGKERDDESGLDDFGARYYASNMGRWMSPDWSATPAPVPFADLGNPQSLNLYSYVLNNPLRMVDADGHDGCAVSGIDVDCNSLTSDAEAYNEAEAHANELLDANAQKEQAQQQSSSTTGNSNPNAAAEQHQYDLVVGRVNKLLGTDDAADHIDPGGKLVGGNYEFSINNADKSDAAFRSSLNSALGEADGDKGAHGGLTPPTHRIGFSTSLHHDNDALHVDHFNGAKFPIGSLLHVIVDVGIGHLPYYGSNHAFSYSGVQ